jgi:hypothetical protein
MVRPFALNLVQEWLGVVGQVLEAEDEAARIQASQVWTQTQVDDAQRKVPVIAPAMRHLLLAGVKQRIPDQHIKSLADMIKGPCKV